MRRSLKTAGKVLLLSSLALAASLVGGTLSLADLPIQPGTQAVVFGVGQDGLGVREGPGYGYQTQAILQEGTEVNVLDGPKWKGYVPWYLVGGYDSSGNQGWSAGNYLQPAADQTPAPEAGPERSATPSSRGGPRGNQSFIALVTGYSVSGRTASGALTQWGVVAADPSVVPLGSKIQIDGFKDVFVVADTGGAVKGNWIDVYFPNPNDAFNFGMQARRVTILAP